MGVELSCGGHPPPFVVRADGEVTEAECAGTLLGAFAEGTWTSRRLELAEGDALVLFSDGVTDTRGAEGHFGQERLRALLTQIGPRPRVADGRWRCSVLTSTPRFRVRGPGPRGARRRERMFHLPRIRPEDAA